MITASQYLSNTIQRVYGISRIRDTGNVYVLDRERKPQIICEICRSDCGQCSNNETTLWDPNYVLLSRRWRGREVTCWEKIRIIVAVWFMYLLGEKHA